MKKYPYEPQNISKWGKITIVRRAAWYQHLPRRSKGQHNDVSQPRRVCSCPRRTQQGDGKAALRLGVVSAIPVRGEGKMPALGTRIVLDLMSSPSRQPGLLSWTRLHTEENLLEAEPRWNWRRIRGKSRNVQRKVGWGEGARKSQKASFCNCKRYLKTQRGSEDKNATLSLPTF